MPKEPNVIQETDLYKKLKAKDSEFVAAIDKLSPIVTERLANPAHKILPEFTLHDINHSARVINYFHELIPSIDEFNDFEIALMILASLFHDLGMALGKEDIEAIKNNTLLDNREIDYNSYKKLYGDNALTEIIRKNHAEISSIIVSRDFAEEFTLQNPTGVNYHEEVCILCASHTKNLSWMKDKIKKEYSKGAYCCNLLLISHLLRSADLLDIEKSGSPHRLYKIIDPNH